MTEYLAGHGQSVHLQLAHEIAGLFTALPQVEAVALGGSRGRGSATTDRASDIDLYVYTHGDVPLADRHAIVERSGGATVANLNLHYWGPGDEWINARTGIEVDIVYFDATWMQDQVVRVVEQHQASMGYSTCLWFTVWQSLILSDPKAWFASLQQRCQVDYPEPLRRNIIALNHPVLRGIIPAYAHQIEKAVVRRDLVSINHRVAALLASYFDIIFALNRQLHPGEKRMVELATRNCTLLPANMEVDLASILLLTEAEIVELPSRVATLLDHLDRLLEQNG
jgi:hypothetical protein